MARQEFMEILRGIRDQYLEAVRLDQAAGINLVAVQAQLDEMPCAWHLAHLTEPLPLSFQILRGMARLRDYWERELGGADRNRPAPGSRRGRQVEARNKAVLESGGMDPTAVAFFNGMTTDGVRKLRDRHGLDPDTGLRRTPS